MLAKRGRLIVFPHFDPKRTALLVVDMQNFYVGEIESVADIIPKINRIAQEIRARVQSSICKCCVALFGGRGLS